MKHSSAFQRVLLAEVGIDGSAFYTSDMTIKDLHRLSLAKSSFKKYVGKSSKLADNRCLELFLEINRSCKGFRLEPRGLFQEEVIGEVKTLLEKLFLGPAFSHRMSLDAIMSEIGLGPGANVGAQSYDFYTKAFNSQLSYTNAVLLSYYRRALVPNSPWFNAEQKRSASWGEALVTGSKLSFVPKTVDISRSICTEPTLNMFFQKGIGTFLESLLKRKFKIDLSTQPARNRMLARKGSIDGTYGTIDLSSASDSISLSLVRSIFPEYVQHYLEIARSPTTTLPSGESVDLEMISSMGNGYTFPLQTLIFASLVVSSYKILGIKPEYGAEANFGVFGDDIIVRRDAYDFVCQMLSTFGFSVNETKSFNAGQFRESCGGDYFAGHDIRGAYIRSLENDADCYKAFNKLSRWSAKSDVALFDSMQLLLRSARFLPVPYAEGDDAGFKLPYCPSYACGFNRQTFQVVYKKLGSKPRQFTLPGSRNHVKALPKAHVDYYGTIRLNKMSGYENEKCGLPGFRYNADGLMLTFLGGYIRDGRIAVRASSRGERTKIHRVSTSSWSWNPVVFPSKEIEVRWETYLGMCVKLAQTPG